LGGKKTHQSTLARQKKVTLGSQSKKGKKFDMLVPDSEKARLPGDPKIERTKSGSAKTRCPPFCVSEIEKDLNEVRGGKKKKKSNHSGVTKRMRKD